MAKGRHSRGATEVWGQLPQTAPPWIRHCMWLLGLQETLIYLHWYVLVLTLRHGVIWEKQDQIWANVFCIPKIMHSRTAMQTNIP